MTPLNRLTASEIVQAIATRRTTPEAEAPARPGRSGAPRPQAGARQVLQPRPVLRDAPGPEPGGRRIDDGQDGDDRVRESPSRKDLAPGGSAAHARRLLERFGGGGGGPYGAPCIGNADHGIDDKAGFVLRLRRLPPDLGRSALPRRDGSPRGAPE